MKPLLAVVLLFVLAAQDDAIEKLVSDLEGDDAAARDLATAELYKIARADVAPVKKLLERESLSADSRARIEEIVKRVEKENRRAAIKGGEIVDGFQATLRPAKETFTANEPVVLELEVVNTTEKPLPFHAILNFEYTYPDHGCSGPSTQAHLNVKMVSGKWRCLNGWAPGPWSLDHPEHLTVEPGKGYVREFVLSPDERELALQPGEYEIQVTYFAKSRALLAEPSDDIRSNVLKVKVDPAP